MKDAHDVINIIFVNGNPSMPAIRDKIDDFTKGRIYRCGGDFSPGNHDGVGLCLFEIEHAVDHMGFFVGDKALGLPFIHEIMDSLGQIIAVV